MFGQEDGAAGEGVFAEFGHGGLGGTRIWEKSVHHRVHGGHGDWNVWPRSEICARQDAKEQRSPSKAVTKRIGRSLFGSGLVAAIHVAKVTGMFGKPREFVEGAKVTRGVRVLIVWF
jgi:hypothetical protein